MITLFDILQEIAASSTDTAKLISKLKAPVKSTKGYVSEYLPGSTMTRTVMITVPTTKLDAFIKLIQSTLDDNTWFISAIGHVSNRLASKFSNMSDKAIATLVYDNITFAEDDVKLYPYVKGMSTKSKAGFKKSKYSIIEIDPAYGSDPIDLGKVRKLYHITLRSNLSKIQSQGLTPKTRTDRTYPPRVFLFTDKWATEKLLPILHNKEKAKNIIVVQISPKKLRQMVPDFAMWRDPEPSGGYFTNVTIPPAAFEKVFGVNDDYKWVDYNKK